MPNPAELFEIGKRVVPPGGKLVAFCPNGNLHMANVIGAERFHKLWGKVHPILISRDFLSAMSEKYGFSLRCWTSPVGEGCPAANSDEEMTGIELGFVCTKI